MTPGLQKDTRTDEADRTGATAEASRFVWYDLHTANTAAAAGFYPPVLGWTLRDSGMADRKYTLFCVGETPVGGILEKPANTFATDAKAGWMGYIGVADVNSLASRVWEAGGKVHRAAEEIPGVGTFAVVADPQGAAFTLFQPLAGMTRPEQPGPSAPGMPAWHDLGAKDWESAFRFYADLFGWTKADAIPMGPNSVYQIFAIGGQPMGGMMTLQDPAQPAGWLFYFNVDEIDAAVNRVKQHGGTVIHGPAPVPGGQQIAICLDTQGAIFGMVAPGRS